MKILNGEAILGDCLIEMQKMQDSSVDHIFTSPPYNRKRNDKYEFYDDTLTDYIGFLRESIKQSIRVSKGFVFFNIQKNYYNKSDVFKIIGEFSEEIVEIFIWEKTNPMPAAGLSITNAYEFFIIFGKSSLKSNFTYTKNIVKSGVNSKMPKNHSAVMKTEIAEWFIWNFTKEGDIILDPFAGIFTTGIVCEKFDRKWIMIEKHEEYFTYGVDRITNG